MREWRVREDERRVRVVVVVLADEGQPRRLRAHHVVAAETTGLSWVAVQPF